MFVFVPPPPPSKRARELGARIAEALRQAIDEFPDIDAQEIDQALRIARARIRTGSGRGDGARLLLIGFGFFLAIAAVIGFLMVLRTEGTGIEPRYMILLGIIVLAGAMLVVTTVLRRSG